jgi:hypothetical protein
MPKRNKKNNLREVADDFDNMLANFKAADLTNAPPSHAAPMAADSTAIKVALPQAPEQMIPEATVFAAIIAGGATKLWRRHRLGLRISGNVMCKVAATGSINVMSFLVEELGNDVNGARGRGGATHLLVATRNGHLDFVRFLVRSLGADVNKGDHNGASPLCVAAESGFLNVVRCLVVDFGATIDQANHNGYTPLFIGAAHGHLDVAQFLAVEHGANINQAAHIGWTMLMVAAFHKHKKIVKWLIKHGADPTAISDLGTATDASKDGGAAIAQTEYLEAKAHCSNPSCSGAGLKKCTGCKQVRYCGQTCQLAHWKAHKAVCKARKEA